VLEVFATARAKSGEAVAAELLSDLVLLLPDTEPRRLLRQALMRLRDAEAELGRKTKQPASLRPDRQKIGPSALKAPSAAVGEEAAPKAMPRQLEDLPVSCTSRGEGRPTSFLLALEAVLRALGSKGQTPVKTQTLERQVKQLNEQQAESLQHMQQHLTSAGGGGLDFGHMDRLMSLRPLLSLKLQGASPAGAGAAADRARCWREWKAAALAAIHRLGPEEHASVQLYVSLCVRFIYDSQGSKTASKTPPVAPAWDRSQALPAQGDFPALPVSESVPRSEPGICLGVPSGGRGRLANGRKKGQSLQAWG